MKLSGRDAARFCAAPDATKFSAALIYGEDGSEVAVRRRHMVRRLLGEDDGADLRLTEMSGAELRRRPALASDALAAQSFFGGAPVVLVSDATDGCVKALDTALSGLAPGSGFLIATAGILPARSKLRKLFEAGAGVVAAPVYANRPDRNSVTDMARAAGVTQISDDALGDLVAIGGDIGVAGLRDLIERLALYSIDDKAPVSAADVVACAPGAGDAALDDVVNAVADGAADRIGAAMSRMKAQGAAPTTITIAVMRHFRQMHTVRVFAERGGVDAAIGRLRPPVFGPRRDAMTRHCRDWSLARTEGALKLLLETDGALRGGSAAAGHALLERALLRLAVSVRR